MQVTSKQISESADPGMIQWVIIIP